MLRRVYEGRRTPFKSLDELKQCTIEVWPAVQARIISCTKSILHFKKRHIAVEKGANWTLILGTIIVLIEKPINYEKS